jgi:hypothetical protein
LEAWWRLARAQRRSVAQDIDSSTGRVGRAAV